mgnify:CR=1 FL=1
MANERWEVILQIQLGLPWRQASAEQRKEAHAEFLEMAKKWKASGIRLIGTFTFPQVLNGYSNNWFFGIDNDTQMDQINRDIMGSQFGKIIEDFSLANGGANADFEENWRSW